MIKTKKYFFFKIHDARSQTLHKQGAEGTCQNGQVTRAEKSLLSTTQEGKAQAQGCKTQEELEFCIKAQS